MNVFMATCVRVFRTDGRFYASSAFATVLTRYASNFEEVTLCTRIIDSDKVRTGYVDVTEKVTQLIKLNKIADILKADIKKEVFESICKTDMVVLRAPSYVACQVAGVARKLKKMCYAEVVGCAWDAHWNHSLKGRIVALYMFLKMKQVVKNADYALYVTNEFLQNRYPTNGKNIGVSNVKIAKITDEVVHKRLEKIKNADKKNITLMTSAAVNVKYKGQEYVIKAIKELKKSGINVTYKLAGGGSKDRLLNIAKKYGVENNIVFLGNLSRDEVFKNLDETDIYVQPSLQEGLPRAVVEALSRGCICIGAKTGGIPELLQERFVLRRKNVKDIVNAIKNICENEDWETIVKENFEKAREYEETQLDKKRNDFYELIKEETKL